MATTKSTTVDKTQAISLVDNFLEQFQAVCNQPSPAKASDLDKWLSQNLQVTSNGNVVDRSLQDYINRIGKMKSKYSRIEIQDRLEEPIVSDNKVVVNYDAVLTGKNNQAVTVNIMAIATVDNNKISRWTQVANQKGTGNWDS